MPALSDDVALGRGGRDPRARVARVEEGRTDALPELAEPLTAFVARNAVAASRGRRSHPKPDRALLHRMPAVTDFGPAIGDAYAAEGPTVDLGRGVHEDKLAPEAVVQIPLKMMNRHGLVAGATGTGKT